MLSVCFLVVVSGCLVVAGREACGRHHVGEAADHRLRARLVVSSSTSTPMSRRRSAAPPPTARTEADDPEELDELEDSTDDDEADDWTSRSPCSPSWTPMTTTRSSWRSCSCSCCSPPLAAPLAVAGPLRSAAARTLRRRRPRPPPCPSPPGCRRPVPIRASTWQRTVVLFALSIEPVSTTYRSTSPRSISTNSKVDLVPARTSAADSRRSRRQPAPRRPGAPRRS